MTTPLPNFSSEELRKAVTEAKPVIERVDEARNAMSDDIKKLEIYLQKIDLNVPFRHPIGFNLVPYDDEQAQVAAALEYGGSASGWIEQEALVWDVCQPAGTFRLVYELSRWNGYVEIDAPGGPYFWDDKTLERNTKPLIETKFEIRKKMYDHLPYFVRALSEYCRIGKQASVSDEIPF